MSRGIRVGAFVVLATALSGCATSEQWAEWHAHSSHFASNEHLGFSFRNQGSVPRVSRRDMRLAAGQGWWGDPVVVRPEQIFGE